MILDGVYFNYAKIREPGKKYQSERKEYSVDVTMSKKQAVAWNKQWSKKKVRVMDNEEYKDVYKVEPPFPDQESQYIVKMKKPFDNKEGVPIPDRYRPRVYLRDGDVLRDITTKSWVGNGSKGDLEYDEMTNSFGTFPVLKNIAISRLVEYDGGGGGGTALGSVVVEEEDESPPKSKNTKPAPVEDDEDDWEDDVPF